MPTPDPDAHACPNRHARADHGAYVYHTATPTPTPAAPPTEEEEEGGMDAWLIALIAVGAVLVLGAGALLILRRR